jgi:hypothetical protein
MADPADDELDAAVARGALVALRKRAAAQRAKATEGTIAAGDHSPNVAIRSPEAATALAIADSLDAVADEMAREPRP